MISTTADAVASHYTSNDLLMRLRQALAVDGIDPERPTLEALAPYDQFHTRGQEATQELARLVQPGSSDHLLDIGSGIGGPARWLARRFGCRVTGIDLTAEFCDVARHLTRLLQMEGRVHFDAGDATALPYADHSFNGAYSMNVSMNIRDKARLYREAHRVLQPGGWLLLSELASGNGGKLDYPTPWAASADHSFLSSPDETRDGLRAAGFAVQVLRSTLDAALAYGVRSRAMADLGERPLQRSVMLIHGDNAAAANANAARGFAEGVLIPIEVLARRQ